jgi:hypothetical protein
MGKTFAMQCDLENIFGELAKQVPTDADASLILSAHNLPVPPPRLTTDRLYIEKSHHEYNYCHRVDALYFHAHKETYRNLALLIFAVTFVPKSYSVHLTLTHPASQVRNLIIENSYVSLEDSMSGYLAHPAGFNYWVEEATTRHFNTYRHPRYLPCFGLTNMHDFVVNQEAYQNRDTVRCFGLDEGHALFAELLLNVSRPQNQGNEFRLQGESAGYEADRGVGVSSAEVVIILPGDGYWNRQNWPAE